MNLPEHWRTSKAGTGAQERVVMMASWCEEEIQRWWRAKHGHGEQRHDTVSGDVGVSAVAEM